MKHHFWRVVLLAIFASPLPLWAQNPQDILVPPPIGTSEIIARNVTANTSGQTGLLNNFILNVPSSWPFLCVSVTNRSAAQALLFKMNAYTSIDPAISLYAKNTASWTQLGVQGTPAAGIAGAGMGFSSTAANPAFLVVKLSNARKIALVPSNLNGSTSPTISMFAALSATGVCGPASYDTVYFEDFELITGNRTVKLIGPDAAFQYFSDLSTVRFCEFYAISHNNAGAGPTLNVRVQSFDPVSAAVDDRVSFTQFTVGDQSKILPFATAGALVDHTPAAGTLAAGTAQVGMFERGLSIQYTVTGVGASYNATVFGLCSR